MILNDPHTLFPNNNTHIVGQCCYPLLPNLMTPFSEDPCSTLQTTYNESIEIPLNIIKLAFGKLLGRFKRLLYVQIDLFKWIFFLWQFNFFQHSGASTYGDRTSLPYWYLLLVVCTTYVWATMMTFTVHLTRFAHSNANIMMHTVFGNAAIFVTICNFNLYKQLIEWLF